MEKTFTLTMADDTSITGLEQNGNCFISSKAVRAEQFMEKGLKKVVITGSDGTKTIYENAALVSVWKDDGKYWIALRVKSQAEVEKEALEAQLADANNAVMELTELIASMQA